MKSKTQLGRVLKFSIRTPETRMPSSRATLGFEILKAEQLTLGVDPGLRVGGEHVRVVSGTQASVLPASCQPYISNLRWRL